MRCINNSLKPYLLVALLFSPIFFDSSGVYKGNGNEGLAIPVSIFIPFLFILTYNFRLPLFNFLVSLILSLVVPLSFGLILYPGDVYVVLFLVYAFNILLGYFSFIILQNFKEDFDLRNLLRTGFIIVSCFAAVWVVFQVKEGLSGGRANGRVGQFFSIYQVWIYWPTMLAISFCASFLVQGSAVWVGRVFILIAIVLTGAREPIAMISMFLLLRIISAEDSRVRYGYMLLVGAGISAAIILILLFPNQLMSIKIVELITGKISLTAGRFDALQQFDLGSVNWLIGNGFSANSIFGSTHNMYAEMYYRGGLFGFILPLSFLLVLIVGYKKINGIIWSLLGSIAVVSFNVNVPLRVPYTGIVIWAMLFLAVHQHKLGQDQTLWRFWSNAKSEKSN